MSDVQRDGLSSRRLTVCPFMKATVGIGNVNRRILSGLKYLSWKSGRAGLMTLSSWMMRI